MIRPRLFLLLAIFAAGLGGIASPAARAENPLEKLHKKLFGEEDRKKDDRNKDDDKKRKEWEKRQREENDRRYSDDRHHSHDHRYSDDRRSYQQPAVVIERRTYVEPAPRIYDRRYDSYEVAPRSYAARSLEADVQSALRREGYYRGPIDGDIGPGTRASIRDFQYDRRLPVTGRIDTSLLRSLGL